MSTNLISVSPPRLQFFDANGNPLAGGKVYTYFAGTTSPLVTYTDSTRTSVNTNPVILDSRGEAVIWVSPLDPYKIALYDQLGSLIYTADGLGDAQVSTFKVLQLSGNGVTTTFPVYFGDTLPTAVYVYIQGVYQQKATYSTTATQIVFTEAPIAGSSNIEIVYITAFLFGDLDSQTIANLNIVIPAITDINTVATNIDTIVNSSADIEVVANSIAAVNFVADNSNAVQLIQDNIGVIQASPANAALAAEAAAYLSTYIDSVVMNVTFPLDCGLITEPVLYNHFDLGGL